MHLFESPTSPLNSRQKRLVAAATLVAALSRLFALSATLWDWDEAQFAQAVREYDVALHHPHPPGFPLYVLMARAARPLVGSDFAACQAVVFLAACVLFPLAFLLAREMRFDFTTAFGGAVLFVFLPNIWFYGGTAFSDIPGVAAVLAACVLLFRGCRSGGAFLAGAAVLGVAAGFRPQALLFGVAPFLSAAWFQWRRSRVRVVAAVLLGAAVVVASYAGAALASASVERYRFAVEAVGHWVRAVDAFTSPDRAPLLTLFDEYVVHPVAGGRLTMILFALAVVGLAAGILRRHTAVLLALATFGPFMAFAWLMLDINSVHRYATAYVWLHAFLAAEGLRVALRPAGRLAGAGTLALALLIAGRFAWWTVPALDTVRTTKSPTALAGEYLAARVPPGGRMWAHGSMAPFVHWALPGRDVRLVLSLDEVPFSGPAVRELFTTEGVLDNAALVFRRERERTWQIARQRYFETSVTPVATLARFGEGWYPEEGQPGSEWRWMGRRAEIVLAPAGGRARLRMRISSQDVETPRIELRFNGEVLLDSPCPPAGVELDRVVEVRSDAPNRLTVAADRTVNLARMGLSPDSRDLSVRLDAFSWQLLP